jgi:UDP-N-acetylglucosamine 4,6-dehydratase
MVVLFMPSYLTGKRVLVTGATGSFGKCFVSRLLAKNEISSIIVFSRDELKQFEMRSEFNSSKLEFVLGDVRDFARVNDVMQNVDIVIHAAAMKQIPAAELNPMEVIKTNILGAENVMRASQRNKVKRVIALSSDKAANPANLYGATKLCSDKLFLSANSTNQIANTLFSVVRYGNVLGSRGSVIPFFKEMALQGQIPITDLRMTRFWLTLDQGVDLVLTALENMEGGEIFVPKIPSFKVSDVARLVAPNTPTHLIGIRPGEKLHEIMITEDDSYYTLEYNDYYTILSPHQYGIRSNSAPRVPEGFSYRSDSNSLWFTDESFMETLKKANLI